jgi:CRP-like cAMP-binding protein
MENLERLLKDHPFLHDLGDAHIRFIVSCARNERYEPGEYLFREGTEAGAMYLLRSGRVALEVRVPGREHVAIETLGEGDVLGWSWLYPPHKWQADARAVERTRVIHFDGGCLRTKVESDHEFGYQILRRLLYQVYQRLERVRLQRLDVYGGS